MATVSLLAQKRKVLGRKVKALRKQGHLPANIYGKKIKSLSVKVDTGDFAKVFASEGETNIIDLKVDKDKVSRPVLITNVQKDPVTDAPLHIDFHQVDLTQKVTVSIPVVVEGESPAEKEKGGVLITLLDEIRVEALPKDLPDEFKLDISNLHDFNDSVVVGDLKVDKNKVSILVGDDEAIVVVQEPKKEEEETLAPTEETEEADAQDGDDQKQPVETSDEKKEDEQTKKQDKNKEN